MKDEDAAKLERALEELTVHPRLCDQGLNPGGLLTATLRQALPPLKPFGTNHYTGVHIVLDWDHRIPSDFAVLRVYATYSGHEARRLETQVRARGQAIAADNLFPEFDLPDYANLDASETYLAVIPLDGLREGMAEFAEFRFVAPWRKEVRTNVALTAVNMVKQLDSYKDAYRRRANEALGGAYVVGWSPPSLAEADNWAIEVWLIIEFDGQSGQAMVFMVDPESQTITREYTTDVHVA